MTLRDVPAVLVDDRLIALREAHDKGVDMGGLCGGNDLLHRRMFTAIGDVFKDGAAENPGILQDHLIGRAEGGAGQIPNVLIIHANLTGIDIVEPHQKVDDGCFAGTGGTDNGDQLAGICLKGKVMQDDALLCIAKGDMVDADVAHERGERCCSLAILQFLFLIQKQEDALGGGQG